MLSEFEPMQLKRVNVTLETLIKSKQKPQSINDTDTQKMVTLPVLPWWKKVLALLVR